MNVDELTIGKDMKQEENESKDELKKKTNIENFQFDTIVKKKKAIAKKHHPKENHKKKVEYKPFKYGRNQFDDLNALSRFLLQEYHHIEKHANRLLMDNEFIKWLKTMSKDEEQFEKWLENNL